MVRLSTLFIHKKLLIGANIFLGILFLLLTMFIVRDSISFRARSSFKHAITTPKKITVKKKRLSDYSGIIAKNPFGIKSDNLESLQSVSKKTPIANNVTLLGTISGEEGKGYAVIADADKKQDVFQVGDQIFDLGKLKAVSPTKVVIKGDRQVEISLLDIYNIHSTKAPAGSNYKGTKRESNYIQRTAKNSYTVDQRKVQEAIANPQQLMTDARLQPRFIKGKQEGFVLREVKRGGIYDRLGLRNGDVLLRINEYNINEPEAALQAFTALRGVDNIQLDVLRRGKRLTLNYLIQ